MTVPVPRDASGTEASSVQVTLIRLEAKVDVALTKQSATLETHTSDLADHETRLRAVEAKPTVSPRQLWSTVCAGVGVLAALAPLVGHLYSTTP